MFNKGLVPILVITIIAISLGAGFIASRLLRGNAPVSVTTTTITTTQIPPTTISQITNTTDGIAPTTLISQQTCNSLCKAKGYEKGTCQSCCCLGDSASVPSTDIGFASDCNKQEKCCCSPREGYSCISLDEQMLGGLADNCKYDPNGKFNSLKECEKSCPYPACSDTDGGKNIYVKGVITLKGTTQRKEMKDKCLGENNLDEYFCNGDAGIGFWGVEYSSCPKDYICQDGACILSQ